VSTGLKLTILSPERKLLEGVWVREATLPGAEGQIQILAGHADFVSTLETGIFSYRLEDNSEHMGVLSTGIVQVVGEEATVMAETFELKGEINLDRAKRAQAQAEEVLKAAEIDEHRFKKYQLKLQRAIIRQQVVTHR
jgi:F-type H+-transporting ATPase subunit epsilon